MLRLAISGIDNATREQLAPRLRGVEIVTLDPASLCQPEGCDAVALLGSEVYSPELVRQWLHGGTSVLLATTACPTKLEAVHAMDEASRKSGTPLLLVKPDDYLPSRQLIREQIAAGKLGAIGLVRSHRWLPARRDQTSHEELSSQLACDLELACRFVGCSPNVVFALRQREFVQTHLGFPGGAMALIDQAAGLTTTDSYQSLHVIGATGAAYADDQQNVQLLYGPGPTQAFRATEGVRSWAALLQAFAEGVAFPTNESFLNSGFAAWQTALRVLDAVHRSLDVGQAIALEDN